MHTCSQSLSIRDMTIFLIFKKWKFCSKIWKISDQSWGAFGISQVKYESSRFSISPLKAFELHLVSNDVSNGTSSRDPILILIATRHD